VKRRRQQAEPPVVNAAGNQRFRPGEPDPDLVLQEVTEGIEAIKANSWESAESRSDYNSRPARHKHALSAMNPEAAASVGGKLASVARADR
jgi:hypothetical protein